MTIQTDHYKNTITIPKASGSGIMVDETAPTYPWKAVSISNFVPYGTPATLGAGATKPGAYYYFSLNDVVWCQMELPSDYITGTDIYFYTNCFFDSTNNGISYSWEYSAAYSKGFARGTMSTPVAVTTTSKYSQSGRGIVEYNEALISGTGLIPTANLLPGGFIGCQIKLVTLAPNGASDEPALVTAGIMYQSSGMGTKSRGPNYFT